MTKPELDAVRKLDRVLAQIEALPRYPANQEDPRSELMVFWTDLEQILKG